MPAAKPTASPARLAANRANAAKSTGPRTPEGKARSRANAVKHGLTGAGVALPGEDAALIEEQFMLIQEQHAPQTYLVMTLARRLALLPLRKARAAEFAAIALRMKARPAAAQFDAARAHRADSLIEAIETNPRAYRRALLVMPEGVDRLIEELAMLLDDLTAPTANWGQTHHRHLDALFGFRPGDLPIHRPTRFSRALMGDFAAIGEEEMADVPPEEHTGWALLQLADAIDAEVARLRAHRETLDHDAIAEDRADSIAAAARFDPSPEAARAHRYEQAAARELSRTLVDLHRAEALAAPEPEPEPVVEPPAPAAPEPMPSAADAPEVEPKSLPGNDMPAGLGSFGIAPTAGSAAAAPAGPPVAPTGAEGGPC